MSTVQPVQLALFAAVSRLGISFLQKSPGYTESQQSWIEWATWLIILLFCHLYSFLSRRGHAVVDDKEGQINPRWSGPSSKSDVNILAVLVVLTHLAISQTHGIDIQWALPLVTVLTFTFTKIYQFDEIVLSLEGDTSQSWQDLLGKSSPQISIFAASSLLLLATAFSSSLVFLLGAREVGLHQLISGTIIVIMSTLFYVLLPRSAALHDRHGSQPGTSTTVHNMLQPLSIRVCAVLTLYLALFAPSAGQSWALIPMMAVLRVIEIISLVMLCVSGAALAATLITVVATAIIDSITVPDSLTGTSFLLVAISSTLQTITLLPKSSISRVCLLIVLVIPLVDHLRHSTLVSLRSTQDSTMSTTHPVKQLADMGLWTFEEMQARQSKTLAEAVTEYRRRYGRAPPPGFDRWYEVAKSKDFLLIDEFDTIMHSLEPFWGVSPATLQSRVKSVEHAPQLIQIKILKDKMEYSGYHYHADFLMEWANFTTWGDILPETTFYISTLDEPRVVAPHDTVEQALVIADDENLRKEALHPSKFNVPSHRTSNEVKWISIGKQDVWEGMLSACSVTSPARSGLVPDVDPKHPVLPFVNNLTTSQSVCDSSDLLHGHGFLASPDSLTITHSLVPIFAQCKPNIFNDVLYPSPYYEMQMTSGDYNETEDPDWNEKLDRLYWAGTATGGYTTKDSWMTMHRQRLTLMTGSDSDMPVNLLERDSDGIWQPRQSVWAKLSDLFHLKITATAQCTPAACQAMRERFNIGAQEPKSAALGSKYVLDIDGNTFSGRYYRLLKSKTCVLKHTSFQEWHDGRLVPWVHFIPVSPGAEELGEMMRYLTQEEEGQKLGAEIARQGMEWARKTLRKEDLEVAFFRVLMEYARIMSDDRDTLGFDMGKH